MSLRELSLRAARRELDELEDQIVSVRHRVTALETAQVSDFDAEVAKNEDLIANTAARHDEAHAIDSHSDTTATGAELDELTGGGETALHSHAGGGGGGDAAIDCGNWDSGTGCDINCGSWD